MLTYAEMNEVLDQAEEAMDQFPRISIPTEHAVAFGFYIRKVVMPAGAMISTKVHGVKSPFCVTRGKCLVKSADGTTIDIEAPYVGITEPGTRRIILISEETEWVTFQPITSGSFQRLIDDFESQVMLPMDHPVAIANSLNIQPERTLNDAR